jgi:hypothetical protein
MDYLVKEEKLELKYLRGKGAWTYHIQIPNTKHIVGKWGTIKVSGFVDNYKIESKNLLSINGQDKLISINEHIRKSIGKDAGDFVLVTLYLISPQYRITEKDILETFKETDVFNAFVKLEDTVKTEMISKIVSLKSEDAQTKVIVQIINKLSYEKER